MMDGEVDGHLGFPAAVVADDDDDAFQPQLHSSPLEPVFSPAMQSDPSGIRRPKNQKSFVEVYRWSVKRICRSAAWSDRVALDLSDPMECDSGMQSPPRLSKDGGEVEPRTRNITITLNR